MGRQEIPGGCGFRDFLVGDLLLDVEVLLLEGEALLVDIGQGCGSLKKGDL